MAAQAHLAKIGVLLSGGMDSAILLAHLLDQGCAVQPFYVRSDLKWASPELDAVNCYLRAVASPALSDLVILDLPLADLYGDHWSLTGRDAPGAKSPDKAVFLPGRNPLLVIKAAVWCQLHGVESLALAALRTNPFADTSDEFFSDFEAALSRAGGRPLRIVRPFSQLDKRQVIELGRRYPLRLTFSCISPVEGRHCGQCNKCAERRRGFRSAGLADPTRYARSAGNGGKQCTA